MSDTFLVRIASDQLDQFKIQSKALCRAIADITGQPRIKPRGGHDLYAYACGYSSHSQIVVLSKGVAPAGETLFIASDERIPVLADRLSGRIEYLSFDEARQALVRMRDATSLGYMITSSIKEALAPALSGEIDHMVFNERIIAHTENLQNALRIIATADEQDEAWIISTLSNLTVGSVLEIIRHPDTPPENAEKLMRDLNGLAGFNASLLPDEQPREVHRHYGFVAFAIQRGLRGL